jgi:hypothetical protein
LNYLLNHWPELTQFLRVSGARHWFSLVS